MKKKDEEVNGYLGETERREMGKMTAEEMGKAKKSARKRILERIFGKK